MAIRFHLAEHVHTDIIGHSVDGFPVRTVEEFLELLRAIYGSAPGVASPAPIETFLAAHPAAAEFIQAPKPLATSFAKESFYAVNAYRFINQAGVSRYGRYRIRPDGPNQYLDATAAAQQTANYLFDEIRQKLAKGAVKMRIAVQIAAQEDVVNDSTVHWPAERPEIDFGTIELSSVLPDNDAEQRHIIFDPIPRVDGIEPSEDPTTRTAGHNLSDERPAAAARRRQALKSVRLDDSARGASLVLDNAPQPEPGPGELLIRVCAAGAHADGVGLVLDVDIKSGEKRVGAIPGHKFSGVIAGAGEDVGAFKSETGSVWHE